jgi:hypothetical protein
VKFYRHIFGSHADPEEMTEADWRALAAEHVGDVGVAIDFGFTTAAAYYWMEKGDPVAGVTVNGQPFVAGAGQDRKSART